MNSTNFTFLRGCQIYIMNKFKSSDKIIQVLTDLYGIKNGLSAYKRLKTIMLKFEKNRPYQPQTQLSQRDAILIVYGDSVLKSGKAPLKTLSEFLKEYIHDSINALHILPFYPYSSDDGFSVIDYLEVNSELGTWEDIERLGEHYHLMFDAVINHVSSQCEWFRKFRENDPIYKDYFITVDEGKDVAKVVRPRSSPLSTRFETVAGEKFVWTTFSEDQIDLNYKNYNVLITVIEILLFYVKRGAKFIRLDAIAYLWKEFGTSCIHLKQTHKIIQLFRLILELIAPDIILITETNVPHIENISYFGDGTNEAHVVYNFTLAPLILHAIHSGSSKILSEWANSLELPSEQSTFFNFTASHDGIGITPLHGIVEGSEISSMCRRIERLGGRVSYKNKNGNTLEPYELNINFLDALSEPDCPDESTDIIAKRFLMSQSIMLTFRGVPGIYFHSLLGSRNWEEGIDKTGHFRSINREKLKECNLRADLADRESLRNKVFYPYIEMIKRRALERSFHPMGKQSSLFCHSSVFAIERISPDKKETVLCLHNLSKDSQQITIAIKDLQTIPISGLLNILENRFYIVINGVLNIEMAPYEVLWLKTGCR